MDRGPRCRLFLEATRILVAVFIAGGLSGCDLGGPDWEVLEEAAERETALTVVQYMSLETMFPDQKLRELAAAAGRGDTDLVRQLVRGGTDVNGRGVQNTTPLVWAMQNPSGFEELLELGADPNVVFGEGVTVIHWAAKFGNLRLLSAALAHGGNPNIAAGPNGDTPLHSAAMANGSAFEELLRAGASIDALDEGGNSPAMVAAQLTRYDLVLLLLERGARLDIQNANGLNLKNMVERDRRTINPAGDQGGDYSKVSEWIEARVDSAS